MNKKEIVKLAEELDSGTEQLTQEIKTIEVYLASLNLGVISWIPAWANANYNFELGYGKHSGKWGLLVRQGTSVWHLTQSPRIARIAAISFLPALFEKMIVDAQNLTEELNKSTITAKEFVLAILKVQNNEQTSNRN